MNSSIRPDEMKEKTLSPGGPSAQSRMRLFYVQYSKRRQQQATVLAPESPQTLKGGPGSPKALE